MADIVRASSLTNVGELVARFGGDIRPWLVEAGIEPDIAGDYNSFLRYSALADIVGRAATELELPDFGLRLASVQSLDMLGPIAVLARNAETVEAALLGVIKYLHTYSPSIKADLHVQAGVSEFEFAVLLRRMRYREHMVELSMGVILGMFRLLCGQDFRADLITFGHRPSAPEAAYTEHLDCPVRFFADRNAVHFPTRLLGKRISGGDETAYALATHYLGRQHQRLDIDQHVAELVQKLMPVGQATLTDVSRELMLHPRTLQRQLAEHGTTFERLLDESRRSVAADLLGTTDLPLSAIAGQLGYAEQATFTRSCRRWFGAPPLAVRRRLAAPDPARGRVTGRQPGSG
ncbi:AraC family transcriptional regulator ligand-binding domain-containing protein [Mycolicibacterium thermoresistibile]